MCLALAACANRGVGPQGGPKDSLPPFVVDESPLNGMLNYKGKKVEITFNEYIQLDNVVENVLISPPQQKPPIVKARGKRVIVTFEEELQDSTTYTIDFGPAICDYTEKNPMEGYTFSFSTGMTIDSLSVWGYVVNAEDLNPISGLVVGIHKDGKTDSLGRHPMECMPFDRVGKTDADGAFAIHNIRPDSYFIYALQDNSRDYVYQPGEGLAFTDTVITPFSRLVEHEHMEDSVVETHVETEFGPADVVLWYFQEDKHRLYFQRAVREEAHRFSLYFSYSQPEQPTIRALRPSEVDSTRSDSAWVDWTQYALWQNSAGLDTLTCWLTDSLAIGQDSLFMELTYQRTDSVYNLEWRTDTVSIVYRAPKLTARAQEALDKKARERKLQISSNAKSAFEIYDTLYLRAAMPIAEIAMDSLHFYERIDTTYHPRSFRLERADSVGLNYRVIATIEPTKQYELRIDSGAIRDVYGVVCDKAKFQMKLKSPDDYANLRIRLAHYDARARIQLLDEKDKVLRELPAAEDGALFANIPPKTYYMRLYIDANGDGQWTTGDWATRRSPEAVYYFPKKLSLKANWDFDETFDHLAIPQLEAKPDALIKDAAAKKK